MVTLVKWMNCGTGTTGSCSCGKNTTKVLIDTNGTYACCGMIVDRQGNFQSECHKVGWIPNSYQEMLQSRVRSINSVSVAPIENGTNGYCPEPLVPRIVRVTDVPLLTGVLCVPDNFSMEGVQLSTIASENNGNYTLPVTEGQIVTKATEDSVVIEDFPSLLTTITTLDVPSILSLTGISDTYDYFVLNKNVGTKSTNNIVFLLILMIIGFIIVVVVITGLMMKWESMSNKTVWFTPERWNNCATSSLVSTSFCAERAFCP